MEYKTLRDVVPVDILHSQYIELFREQIEYKYAYDEDMNTVEAENAAEIELGGLQTTDEVWVLVEKFIKERHTPEELEGLLANANRFHDTMSGVQDIIEYAILGTDEEEVH